jgi:hypothetical protein
MIRDQKGKENIMKHKLIMENWRKFQNKENSAILKEAWEQGSTLNSDEMRAMADKMDQSEESEESEEYLDPAFAPTEDNQEPIVAANDALHKALEALDAPDIDVNKALNKALKTLKTLEAVTKFNMDSRITLADLDYKIVRLNRAIAKIKPAGTAAAIANINLSWRRIQGGDQVSTG